MAYSQPRFNYLCKRFEWTNCQPQSINWKVIGLAKIKLSRSQSILAQKSCIYLWLNLDRQKVKFCDPQKMDYAHAAGKGTSIKLTFFWCEDPTYSQASNKDSHQVNR